MEEDKKAERKRKRFSARLHSSKGIVCSDTPGPKMVLCNAGHATGLGKEDICKIIKEKRLEIPLPKYIAEKGESHSFLVFDVTKSAESFFNVCNGKVKIDENGTPLYLNYVEEVPNLEIICSAENPKGLLLLNNFITIEEENIFLKLFDWTPESSNLKNRQVKHYGYEFRYGSNDVDLNMPLVEKIPKECDVLWQRMKEQGFDLDVPDQLTVNKYIPGQGIPSHVDKHSPFGDTILSLSLGSNVVMDWRHHSGKYVPVLVLARSLLVMQDEARYDWQHGIQPRTYDPIIEDRYHKQNKVRVITNDNIPRDTRLSLTFRWTRSGPCECKYKTLCDTVNKVYTDNLEDDIASNLEELHVHQVSLRTNSGPFQYNSSQTVAQSCTIYGRGLPGSVLLDLGCGNGKNILKRNDIVQIACERSSGLLSECKEHILGINGADCIRLDLLQVPLKNEGADVVICIAVIHHFSSKARRLQAISNIYKLLRNGGKALITVWAKDQTKSNYLCKSKLDQTDESNETQVSVGGVQLPVHENRTQFKHNDLLVPWKLRKVKNNRLENQHEDTLLRYYHVFEENELDLLCKEANFDIEHSFYEEGNWCVVCKKKINIMM